MKIKIYDNCVKVELDSYDTQDFARGEGVFAGKGAWPCSTLSGHSIWAEFDSNGLIDLQVNGQYPDMDTGLYGEGGIDIDGHEFNALMSSALDGKLDVDHPCFFVACGQFGGKWKERQSYNDNLRPHEQIDMEEKIAAHIFDNFHGYREEAAGQMGKDILLMVLSEFRPDFVE